MRKAHKVWGGHLPCRCLAWVLQFETPQVTVSSKPPHPLYGPAQLRPVLTSCLRVSLAIISLWSMRDSSSTSSSD